MYRDNFLYFLATTVTNLTVLVIQTLPSSHPFIDNFLKPNVLPYATLITVAMGTRVFLNLTLYNTRQKEAEDSLPHTVKLTPLTGRSGLTGSDESYTMKGSNLSATTTKDGGIAEQGGELREDW